MTSLLRAELETGCLKEALQRSALYRQMVPPRVLPRRRSQRIIARVRSPPAQDYDSPKIRLLIQRMKDRRYE
jgi:hypothetical protein